MSNQSYDLDRSLIDFTDKDGVSSWTIREAVEGVQIFGGIGSGKTSGSGRLIALKYLSNGFGGLVLTAKESEKDLWVEYAKQTNREQDLIIVRPGGKHCFNFLEYESSRRVGGISLTENIVEIIKTVIQSSAEKSNGKNDDPFWEDSLDMLMFNVIDLCIIAYGKVSVQDMYDIALTAPKSDQKTDEKPKYGTYAHAFETARKKISDAYNEYLKFLNEHKIKLDDGEVEKRFCKRQPEGATVKRIDQFFIEHYRNLSDKTRSIIEIYFSGFLFRLLKEPIYSLFCAATSTFTPADSLQGKVIILDLPVKMYNKVGRDIQVLFKFIWQRAMERRNVETNARPVFLWADEAQHFLHEYDAEYQATARGSRIATVYISQNLPNYYANMGGLKYQYKVKSFLGTLGTKIFHANADTETNRYASELIGEGFQIDTSRSTTTVGDSFSSTKNESFKLEKMVRPEELVGLKNGSPLNNFIVEGYMHRQGRLFANKQPFKKVSFSQK